MNVKAAISLIFCRFATSRLGAVAVEYAFLAAFIAIVAAVGMVLVGPNLQTFFIDTGASVQNAGSGNFVNEPFDAT